MVEWNEWTEERKKGIADVEGLRKRAEDLAKELQPGDEEMDVGGSGEQPQPESGPASAPAPAGQATEEIQNPAPENAESRD